MFLIIDEEGHSFTTTKLTESIFAGIEAGVLEAISYDPTDQTFVGIDENNEEYEIPEFSDSDEEEDEEL